MQTNQWLLPGLSFDGQHIETALGGFDVAGTQKLLGHAGNIMALLEVHGGFGRGLGSRELFGRLDSGSRFYFHKRQNRAVVSDHINFALQTRRGELSRNQHVAVTAEILVGVGFAANAGTQGTLLSREGAVAGSIPGIGSAQALTRAEINDRKNQSGE